MSSITTSSCVSGERVVELLAEAVAGVVDQLAEDVREVERMVRDVT